MSRVKPTNFFRARLGQSVYFKTNEFILNDPNIYGMQTTYNMLHDTHTRKYFHRKDIHSKLQKENFITEDGEVVCSLKDYKMHQMYLENLKRVSDRTMNELQREQLRKFLVCQEEGRIPRDVTLAEMTEILLDEEVEGLRRQLRADPDWKKLTKRQKTQREQEYFREMNLLNWKMQERVRLKRIENEVRHEWNREKYLQEAQERRNRKKLEMVARKCANQQTLLLEKIHMSEDRAMEQRNKDKPRQPSPAAKEDSPPIEISQAVTCNMVKPTKQRRNYWASNR